MTNRITLPSRGNVCIVAGLRSSVRIRVAVVPIRNTILGPRRIVRVSGRRTSKVIRLKLSKRVASATFRRVHRGFASLRAVSVSTVRGDRVPSGTFTKVRGLAGMIVPRGIASVKGGTFTNYSRLRSLALGSISTVSTKTFSKYSSLADVALFKGSRSSGRRNSAHMHGATNVGSRSFRNVGPGYVVCITKNLRGSVSSGSGVIIGDNNAQITSASVILASNCTFGTPTDFGLNRGAVSLSIRLGCPSKGRDGR